MVQRCWTFFLLTMMSLGLSPMSVNRVAAAEIDRDVAYGAHPENTMDLCQPNDGRTRHPGVIIIHGGGWVQGDKKDMEPECRRLAEEGILGVNIDYRLALPGDAATQWPAQLADSQLAVRWVRAHAAEIGLDKERICAWGSSAGGQLALLLGVRRAIVPSDEAARLTDESAAVKCVVSASGPTDITTVGPPFERVARAAIFGGVSLQQDPERYRSASPALYVARGSPPMLLLHGISDPVVPYSQATELVDVARRFSVSVKLLTYAGGHLETGLEPDERLKDFNDTIAFLVDNLR